MTTFNQKTIGLKNLEKFYKKAPKQFARASAGMTNNQAFETRNAALINIASDMNIRSDRFVSARMKVNRARPVPISQQKAEVGSVRSPRFSGWIEQETGKAPLRTRTFGIAARRGKEGNSVSAKARLKPSNQFYTPSDFAIKAKDEDRRTMIFLQLMNRHQQNKPFVMRRRYKKMKKGIYMFSKGRGQLKLLHEFGAMKVKRKRWMRPAAHKVNTKANIRKQWARAIKHVLK